MRRFNRFLAFFISLVMTLGFFVIDPNNIRAEDKSEDEEVYNFNYGSHGETGYYRWNKTYLEQTKDGFMVVFPDQNSINNIKVIYYDKNFEYQKNLNVPMEFPKWGGFHFDGENYYVMTGKDEDSTNACYCLTKYDTSWEKIASCTVEGDKSYVFLLLVEVILPHMVTIYILEQVIC